MLAGIIFQLISMIVFSLIALHFYSRARATLLGRPVYANSFDAVAGVDALAAGPVRILVWSLSLASLAIIIRGIYRTVELAQGWHGTTMSHEAYFDLFDVSALFFFPLTSRAGADAEHVRLAGCPDGVLHGFLDPCAPLLWPAQPRSAWGRGVPRVLGRRGDQRYGLDRADRLEAYPLNGPEPGSRRQPVSTSHIPRLERAPPLLFCDTLSLPISPFVVQRAVRGWTLAVTALCLLPLSLSLCTLISCAGLSFDLISSLWQGCNGQSRVLRQGAARARSQSTQRRNESLRNCPNTVSRYPLASWPLFGAKRLMKLRERPHVARRRLTRRGESARPLDATASAAQIPASSYSPDLPQRESRSIQCDSCIFRFPAPGAQHRPSVHREHRWGRPSASAPPPPVRRLGGSEMSRPRTCPASRASQAVSRCAWSSCSKLPRPALDERDRGAPGPRDKGEVSIFRSGSPFELAEGPDRRPVRPAGRGTSVGTVLDGRPARLIGLRRWDTGGGGSWRGERGRREVG